MAIQPCTEPRLDELTAEPADALEAFAVLIWSDCRLPGSIREAYASKYHGLVLPALRNAGRMPNP